MLSLVIDKYEHKQDKMRSFLADEQLSSLLIQSHFRSFGPNQKSSSGCNLHELNMNSKHFKQSFDGILKEKNHRSEDVIVNTRFANWPRTSSYRVIVQTGHSKDYAQSLFVDIWPNSKSNSWPNYFNYATNFCQQLKCCFAITVCSFALHWLLAFNPNSLEFSLHSTQIRRDCNAGMFRACNVSISCWNLPFSICLSQGFINLY